MKTNSARTGFHKLLAVLLFALYMAVLLKILLIRSPAMLMRSGAHAVNLIPFHTIVYYTGIALHGGAIGARQAFANIAGNVILFLPFGYFLPIFIRPLHRGVRIALVTAGFSTLIEVSQYLLHVGSSDVDDVILNTLGGIAGFSLLQLISNRKPLTRAGYAKILYLSAFLFCSGYLFAATQYSAQLGVTPITVPVQALASMGSGAASGAAALIRDTGVQDRPAAAEAGEAMAALNDRVLDRLRLEPSHENHADVA